jgi:two-component system, OmpR family, sensor kinase
MRLPGDLRSLRVRIPLIAMGVFVISLAVGLFLAYELFLQAGRSDIDTVLEREQRRFDRSMSAILPELRRDGPLDAGELREAVTQYLRLNPSTESYWTIVWFEDGGGPLAATNGPPQLEPLFRDGRLPIGTPLRRETLDTEAGKVRSASAPVVLDGREVAIFQVVAPLAPVQSESLAATGRVAAASGLSLLLGGLLLAAALRTSLKPLQNLAHTARATQLHTLGQRVPEPDGDDEVGMLAREFNSMLDRLADASQQQREFMASVGHELRTPLTIARGHLELLATVSRDDQTTRDEMIDVVSDELVRMGRLVEDLMTIARADMDDFARPRQTPLVGFFDELRLRLVGLDAGDVEVADPPDATVDVDPDRLAQAVLNLVVNARVHTPAGTSVRILAAIHGDELQLTVADDGPGIDPAIRDTVFSPFVSAGTHPGSAGLGLAVVKAVVHAHGGHVTLDTSAAGTRVTLHLPRAVDRPDDRAVTQRVATPEDPDREVADTQRIPRTSVLPADEAR